MTIAVYCVSEQFVGMLWKSSIFPNKRTTKKMVIIQQVRITRIA